MRFVCALAVMTTVLFVSCSSGEGFDRANDDFVVTIDQMELAGGEAFGIGFHPTDDLSLVGAEKSSGPFLICPVDSAGVLMPGVDLVVPPCLEMDDSVELDRTGGQSHVAVGFRAAAEAAAETLTLQYRQADGYFALFYRGEPQQIEITGPSGADPWVSNTGQTTVIVNETEIQPGSSIEVSNRSVSIRLASETSLDIDWFAERTPFLPSAAG